MEKKMGGTSEREYREKISKIRDKVGNRIRDVRNDINKIERIKTDALKKIEDMRRSVDQEINRMEGDIMKSKDLAPESKHRLHSEIAILKNEVENNYAGSRRQIAETIVPVMA